jgi:hypothetical protein
MVNQNMKKGDKQNEEKPALLFPVCSCHASKPEKKNLNQNQTLQLDNRTVIGQKSRHLYFISNHQPVTFNIMEINKLNLISWRVPVTFNSMESTSYI